MGFNYGLEKARFDTEWENLRKEYLLAGMSEDAIEEMYKHDYAWFKSRRTFENHTQDDTIEMTSSIIMPAWYKDGMVAFSPENLFDKETWKAAISNTGLRSTLEKLSERQLRVLYLLIFEQRTQAEIALIIDRSQSAVSRELKKIKKISKKFENNA